MHKDRTKERQRVAAASEMYQALDDLGKCHWLGERARCWCRVDRNDSENPEMHSLYCRAARAALAKAEGKKVEP
jgi:hypothetical protein